MKSFKKVSALLMVSALCLSMGISVLAKGDGTTLPGGDIPNISSPKDDDLLKPTETFYLSELSGAATPVNTKPVVAEVEEILENGDTVKDIMKDAGLEVKEEYEVVVLEKWDLELQDNDHKGKITLGFGIDSVNVNPGDTLYLLHLAHNGTWEVYEATVSDTGTEIVFELDELSPVALVKVMSNGNTVVLDKNGDTKGEVTVTPSGVETKPTDSSTVKKSPKTGE